MNRIKITIIALLFIPLSGFAQDEEPLTKKGKRQNRTTYRGMTYAGLGIGSFRDFATSPLTYTGVSIASGGFEERETRWGTPFSVGFFGSSFNNHSSKENYNEVHMLLKIKLKEAKWWRDACLLYFQTFSKKQLPLGMEKPTETLKYYKSLKFPFAPGN